MGLLQEKLSKFRLPQMYMEKGVYPYFREIDNDGRQKGIDVRVKLIYGSDLRPKNY